MMTDTQQSIELEAGISMLPETITKVEQHLGCTLAQYAEAKRLPIDFLKTLGIKDMKYMGIPALRIPYRDAQGKEKVVRFRIAPDGKDRFRWKKGSKLSLYRFPGSLTHGINTVLVEGESDCHTLWYYNMCAYGVPGAGNWKEDFAAILEQHDVIYVLIEPDISGETMLKWLARSAIRHRVKLVRLYEITGFKDPSAMHIADPENFREKWQQALAVATPYVEYETAAKKAKYIESGEHCSEVMPPDANGVDDIPLPPQFSEDALALRFTMRHKDELRYVALWGRWLRWTGTHWAEDNTLAVFNLARIICREASGEAMSVLPDKSAMRIANKIASAQTVAAVLKLAGADRVHASTVDQWDADPSLLNTLGGVIDLCTGIMHKHKPDHYMTKITSVTPGGECPIWLQFLQTITAGNDDLIAYLRRKAGYGLTGDTKEQDIDFFYGTGGNGKGVFLNSLTGVMNSYAAVANIDTFTVSNSDKHPTDLAMLRGARLVTAQETEEGRRWAESRIKALTGGDHITARFMRQDFFTYIPQFKLIIAGNHRPSLRNVDEAIRRRFHLVPFTVTISEKEKDKDLPAKLKAEWPGILKWAISEAREWYENGLNPPTVVRDATEKYLAAEDNLELWMNERCIFGKGLTDNMTDLFANWKLWCERAGEHSGTMKGFSQNLRAKRGELTDWRCPVTRRSGLQGIQTIKSTASNWSDTT